ncbi:hypothetical protein [Streptomyces sp. SID3343]|uniref:hypothetical protein n=1 Tax=Streptomyces sp. SID3343 TaxID=2690260 RepID=UPI00137164D5|nr:hypothetical protein [Streptomyces sp. SID3343]MYV97140.1 hypothetical protein [Streptomyces sp. SID3343]
MVTQGRITRSPHDRMRRSALAAASGARIERAAVAVYVAALSAPERLAIADTCRTYAELHDWRVETVLSESPDQPLPHRPELDRALSMVVDRVIVGIVTARRSMISPVESDVASFEETLRRSGGFLTVLPTESSEVFAEKDSPRYG